MRYSFLAVCLCVLNSISCTDHENIIGLDQKIAPSYQWKRSSLSAQQVDSIAIESAQENFFSIENSYALLIARHGYLVFEKYTPGLTADNDFELRSATKSIVSTLIGIAIREGKIHSLDQQIVDFYPTQPVFNTDTLKRTITIRHLLSMQGGFDHTDAIADPHFLTPQQNWIQEILSLPLRFAPGQQYYYSSLQSHLLSGILTAVTSISTLSYAHNTFFDKYGIRIQSWYTDPQGIYFGGSGITMKARDILRFGDVLLKYQLSTQDDLLPNGWMDTVSTRSSARKFRWGSVDNIYYGLHWWISDQDSLQWYFAAGSGGQLIVIIPEKQAVIVTCANPNVDPQNIGKQEDSILEIIALQIIPALR